MKNKTTATPGDYSPGDIKLGISMAASWAWGVSLGVSFSILQTRGLIPFIIWGLFNTAAMTIYGLYVLKNPGYLRFTQNRAIKLSMAIIQLFAIWINIKIMYDFLFDPVIPLVLALGIIILTIENKFRFSVESDQVQFMIMMIGLLAVIRFGKSEWETKLVMGADYNWALWGGICLLAGPFLDAQHFQRAEKAENIRPFLIGSITFGVYLSLVLAAFMINQKSIILIVIVIAVATSTIDSAVASLQYLTGNFVAGILSIVALLTWPLFMTNTAAEIWSWYASGRVFIVIPLIILGVYYGRTEEKRV